MPTPQDPRDVPEVLEAEPIPPAPEAGGPLDAAVRKEPTRDEVRRAWMVALAADVVQFFLLPMVGATAGLMVGIDVLVAFLLVRWMGWHIAFLPAFVTELVPIANVVPSWTLAMWIVTRLRRLKA